MTHRLRRWATTAGGTLGPTAATVEPSPASAQPLRTPYGPVTPRHAQEFAALRRPDTGTRRSNRYA
jgi:hypothetical protein